MDDKTFVFFVKTPARFDLSFQMAMVGSQKSFNGYQSCAHNLSICLSPYSWLSICFMSMTTGLSALPLVLSSISGKLPHNHPRDNAQGI